MTNSFVKTDTILDKILAHKQTEIADAKVRVPIAELKSRTVDAAPVRDFATALQKDTVALIAEVKRASPSRGRMIEDFDPIEIARAYASNGASAISVLTDERFFQGHLQYLTDIRNAVHIRVLRKEFILDDYQVYEARAAGADAILLIVAALSDSQLSDLHGLTSELGMTALVEVHNLQELERLKPLQPRVIGVNNRDLKTFDVDLQTTARLAEHIPANTILVAESGIKTAEDVAEMGRLGADAVLVGESLMKSQDLARAVQDFSSQKRQS